MMQQSLSHLQEYHLPRIHSCNNVVLINKCSIGRPDERTSSMFLHEENQPFFQNYTQRVQIGPSNRSAVDYYSESFMDLINRILCIYFENQNKGWDGYQALPIQYVNEALSFSDLLSRYRLLVESVNIIPENDGCLCFEWRKSDKRYINISIKDRFIYDYKIDSVEGCGETSFEDSEMLLKKINIVII